MSTGLQLEFIEQSPNVWYYVLEDYDCPEESWDWKDYATAYGPFDSLERAERHKDENSANTGHSITIFNSEYIENTTYKSLFYDATVK